MLKRSRNPTLAGKYLLSTILIWGVSISCKLFAESYGQAKSVVKSRILPKTTLKAKNGGVPNEINYQGWLGDAIDTTGITDVPGMIFRLYTAPTGGTSVWSETHVAVTVDKGIFNVLLGSVNPIPSNIFTGDPLWLETQVTTDTLSPRKKLVSVGYAIKSEEAEHSIHSDTAGYASSSAPDSDWTISGSNLYAQNTSWNVGIGTTSPSTDARLSVAANGAHYAVYGKGSTGKKAGVFGSAYGANYGVYGLGFTGGDAAVYGLADGADYAGYFDGDVHITGEVTMDTVVRYYSIPGCEFGAVYENYDWYRASYLYTLAAGATHWVAGVHLPDGAVVTEINGYVYDNDASDIIVRLYRSNHSGGYNTMADVTSSGASTSVRTFTDNSIDYATIDNEDYYYYARVGLNSGDSNHRLYQIRIKYEITQPLP